VTNEAKRSEESGSTVGLGVLERIEAHLRQLSPHMLQRDGVVLLKDAREEIYRLREAVLVQLCETEDSEYMTGAQRNQFARDALTPNADVTGLAPAQEVNHE